MSDACLFTAFITQVVINSDGCIQLSLSLILEKEELVILKVCKGACLLTSASP